MRATARAGAGARRRVALGALGLVAALGASLLVATPASAAAPVTVAGFDPDNRVGEIASLPIDSNKRPTSVSTTKAFPGAVASDGLRVIVANADGSSPTRAFGNVKSFTDKGWDPAQPVSYSGTFIQAAWENVLGLSPANGKEIIVLVALIPGGTTSTSTPGADDASNSTAKYQSSTLVYSTATASWSVKAGEDAAPSPVQKTATTTTAGYADVTDTTATLSATVAPSAAGGDVTFKNGAEILGTATLVGGTATLPVTGLTASTTYSVTAEYAENDDYRGSTSAAVEFTTNAPADTDTTSHVGIAANPPVATDQPLPATGLKLTVSSSNVVLDGPTTRYKGAAWTATGDLGTVTVNDDRQSASGTAWVLTGQSSAFKAAGKSDIAASYFGWTPKDLTGAGSKGDPATSLATGQTLATGAAPSTTANVQTTVNAGLSLALPAGVGEDGGAYTATLTLTLV